MDKLQNTISSECIGSSASTNQKVFVINTRFLHNCLLFVPANPVRSCRPCRKAASDQNNTSPRPAIRAGQGRACRAVGEGRGLRAALQPQPPALIVRPDHPRRPIAVRATGGLPAPPHRPDGHRPTEGQGEGWNKTQDEVRGVVQRTVGGGKYRLRLSSISNSNSKRAEWG